ncbi:MAG: bifunctional phosphoserine phosphatase/homoserine phosphotransferase ThrH [Desulfobacterales bacterium]|nr:bifunctional phosphoserine phosphatase/homoserine phosphotransferase ThrH [Desulfobacterales bacterium]
MYIVCSDLEGVFVPEIWISVAQKTGIEALKLTTRDEPDYDILMQRRIAILKENKLKLADITGVISGMDPLDGALEFLDWLRSTAQVIVLSDTFVEFAGPLMQKLNRPTLFCNSLKVDSDGAISGYVLRQPDGKRKAIVALKSLNYQVLAMGDSYNDITMIQAADTGILFRPPQNVRAEYPDLPVADAYKDLKKLMQPILGK